MMKLLTTCILFFATIHCFGQQESIPGQFWNNQTRINPAFAGLEYQLQGGLFYRNQWNKISGAPQDIHGFFNTSIGDKWGIGINLDGQTSGVANSHSVSIPVSYRIQLNDKQTIAIGAALGYSHIQGDLIQLIPPTAETDPLLFQIRGRKIIGHTGVAYKNHWITGSFSVRALEIAELGENTFNYQPSFNTQVSLRIPTEFGSGFLDHTEARLEALHTYINGFGRMQLNLRMVIYERFNLFGGYVFSDQFIVGGGWDFYKKFRATYSVGFSRSPLQSAVTSFTHEAALIYQLPIQD